MREFTALECAQDMFSDLYKDVNGFRPRFVSTEDWNDVDFLNAQCASMSVELVQVMADEAAAQNAAVAKFEEELAKVVELGAGSRAVALRWMLDAEPEYVREDLEHFCWTYHLPFTYVTEKDLR